jgi:hypothetical protein
VVVLHLFPLIFSGSILVVVVLHLSLLFICGSILAMVDFQLFPLLLP